MAYVIAEPCIDTKDNSCVEVCPGRLHPSHARRARLRPGQAALHRSRGVHRLRRLRRGLPGGRLLRRGPAARRVAEATSRSTRTTSSSRQARPGALGRHRQRRARDLGHAAGPTAPGTPPAPAASPRSVRAPCGRSPGRRARRDPRAPAGGPRRRDTRSSSWSGILPSSGTSSSSASTWPPPSPKIVKRSPSGVVKPDMFSTTPAISRSKRSAVSAARLATFCAAGCGVVTITKRACGSSWASVIDTSPVPGGRSISR